MSRWFSDYNIAVFTLLFMSLQFVVFEGAPISTPKVIFMACTPILLFFKSPHLSKAIIYSIAFWCITVGMTVFQHGTVRMSTFYYCALFLFTFCLYYNLLYYNNVFDIDDFINIIKFIIFAYFGFLVVQQLCIIGGIRNIGIFNLYGAQYYTVTRLNSLALEPSHAARLLTVYFYAFLKLNELKEGQTPSIKYLWSNYKWLIVAFLYTMIGIGSGTSFVGLAILGLYFLKKEYVIWIIFIGFVFYMIVPMIHYEPLERAMNVFNATLTMDSENVTKVDHSASSRVNILIDTFNNFDPTDEKLWFGYGVDQGWQSGVAVSGMSDYGLISYIAKLTLFFGCCFLGLFSLETLMFILLFSLNIGNIAYGWAALMVFATIKYFYNSYVPEDEEKEEDDENNDTIIELNQQEI